MKSIVKTNFKFPNQTSIYQGKVRDVYNFYGSFYKCKVIKASC